VNEIVIKKKRLFRLSFRFAEIHNCKVLQESALSFIHSHFTEIAEDEEFLDIPQNLLIRLISSETIRVDHEYQVFMASLKWITHKAEERRQFVFEILSHVRLALVSVQLIDNAISECRDCSLKVALRSIKKDLTGGRGQLVALRVAPRLGAKKTIYIIGGSKRETTGNRNSGWTNDCIFESVIKYDIFRGEWTESAPMNVARILPGVATLFQKIFVVGGERGSQILANGEVYDPEKNVWESLPPMIVPRCEFGLCAVGGTLYAG
jgi:actin-binding protein IPP